MFHSVMGENRHKRDFRSNKSPNKEKHQPNPIGEVLEEFNQWMGSSSYDGCIPAAGVKSRVDQNVRKVGR